MTCSAALPPASALLATATSRDHARCAAPPSGWAKLGVP
jgi:hypothetical protein